MSCLVKAARRALTSASVSTVKGMAEEIHVESGFALVLIAEVSR